MTDTYVEARTSTLLGDQKIRKYWRDIYGIEFSVGPGENDPSGLYTRESEWGGGTLLVRQVGEEEAQAIVDAVYRRFYFVEMKAGTGGSPLESMRGKITTLFGDEK